MADLLIALIELVEAEARDLRRATIQTGFEIALLLFAGLIVAAGMGLLGWALYLYIAAHLGAILAALVVGVIAVLAGGGTLWRIRHNYR